MAGSLLPDTHRFEERVIREYPRSVTSGYSSTRPLGLCQGSPLRAESEALDPTGLEAATDAAAAMVAERCGDGAFETPLQALVVETTR